MSMAKVVIVEGIVTPSRSRRPMPNAKSSNLKEEKLIVQKGFLILETFWFSNLTSFE
jgi:hypothetical protein